MDKRIHISGPATQVHEKMNELIRKGLSPVLIHEYQPEKPVSYNNTNTSSSPSHARQVINLGRKA